MSESNKPWAGGTALAAALLLALGAAPASAEDCAPLIAAMTNKSVPYAAIFITSGRLPPCQGMDCPAPPTSPAARALAARLDGDRASAGYHVWTGKDWWFWLRERGWFSLHDYRPEPAPPRPRDLTMSCAVLGEETVNGEAAIRHALRLAASGMSRADYDVWLSKATGLVLKSVHRTGRREFVQLRDYRDVPRL